MKVVVAFLSAVFLAQACFAWSEGGQHLIAVMAFEELMPAQQSAVLEVLKAHPRFDEDFTIPGNSGDIDRWLVGRAAYWPDLVRQTPFDRPKWHYQLGAALVIGDVPDAPDNPGPCPANATLETKDLYIAQAIELCRRVLADKSQPVADRAVALCWICHLVSDAHQPCHAGSLYCARFPEGDKGANSIGTKQGRSLHTLWDDLLGTRFDAADVKRRSHEIKNDKAVWESLNDSPRSGSGLDPKEWLLESAEYAQSHVYAPQVLKAVENAAKGEKLEIDLSDEYLKEAGRVAQRRAASAAQRLAEILRQDVGPPPR